MNNKFSILTQSIGIAINRSTTQIASIGITAMLGLINTSILAEFSLALSFASIFFVLVTTIQIGIQSEFGCRFSEKNFKILWELFNSVSVIVLILSCFFAAVLWFMPNPFSATASLVLSQNAYKTLKIFAVSLPLVGLLTTIAFFLESMGRIMDIARLRIMQLIVQTAFVLIVIVGEKLNIGNYNLTSEIVAIAYVCSDLVILLLGASFLYLTIKKNSYLYKSINKNIFFGFSALIDTLRLGLPLMFGMVAQRSVFYLYVNFSASLGILQASAFSIVNSCIYFLQIPILGVAHLMTIKISQARGEESPEILRKTSFECERLFMVEVLFMLVFLLAFYPFIFEIFTNDLQVLQLLSSLKWTIVAYFFMNVILTFSMSFLRGHSDTFIPQIILILCLTAGVLACYLLLLEQIGLQGMLIIFSLSGFGASYFLIARILKFKKKEPHSMNMLPEL